MKKGLNVWCFRGHTLHEIFVMAHNAGFDGVELAMGDSGELTPETTPDQLRAIRADAAAVGVELYSVASSLYWTYSFTANETEIAEKAVAIACAQLDAAAALGCSTILVVPGMVCSSTTKQGDIPYDVAYDRALKAMRQVCRHAEQVGVDVGIENVWNRFLLSPLEMKRFIEEIGSPRAVAYFDVGNVLQTGYPEHWIRILGSHIKQVHFKDFKLNVGNITGFCDLLSGDVNYPAVMAAFADIGYDGWVTGELSPSKTYPDLLPIQAAAAMDMILSK